MDLSVYGITPGITLAFLLIGICVGLVWQQNTYNMHLYYRKPTAGEILAFIAFFFFVIFATYLFLGDILTSFVYSIVGAGIVSEFICSSIGEVILSLGAKMRHSTKPHTIPNSATWHILPEEQKE